MEQVADSRIAGADCSAWLISPSFPIPAGATTTATLIIENRGEQCQDLWISVQDLDDGWCRLSRASVSVVPGQRAEVTVVLEPPHDFRATAGAHPFAVAALASDGQQFVATGSVNILPFDDHSAALIEDDGQYRLLLSNHGNRPLSWQLSAHDPTKRVDCQVDRPWVELAPGEQWRLPVRAAPAHRAAFGPPRERSFDVRAIPARGDEFRMSGVINVRPVFRDWRRPAAFLAVVLVAALGLGSYFSGLTGNFSGGTQSPASNVRVLGVAAPPTTVLLVTPTPSDQIFNGGNAVVVNSPPGSCLSVRQYHTRLSSDPRSQILGQICNGDVVHIISSSVQDEGYTWWTVDNGKGLVGWAAEKLTAGGAVYLKAAP